MTIGVFFRPGRGLILGRRGPHDGERRLVGAGIGRISGLVSGLALGLSLLSASCEHRKATATGRPVLYIPADAPTEEPPPAPLSEPLVEAPVKPKVSPQISPPSVTPPPVTTPTTPPQATQPTSKEDVVSGSEIPCGRETPPGMVCVPGGPFWRGNDNAKPDERPRSRVVVSPFFLDTYEVDNEQYFRCVEAGGCDPPIKYYPMFAKPKQPVVAVSWYEAYEYCRFAGKRLPTEAEWEKAARGPDGEVYPWGNEPPSCDRAVYEEPLGAKGCGTGLTSPVGSRPAYRYGLFDMAGNSWEWVDDWKTDCYGGCSKACGAACEGPDPKGPCGGGPKPCAGFHEKVLKGGSWYFTGDRMRGAERRGVSPSNRGPHRLGFRCAKSVQ